MPTVVVGTEKNFTALRPLLFGDRVSAGVAREAKAALREANPHADLDKLQPGTVLTVPEGLPGVAAEPAPLRAGGFEDALVSLSSRGKLELDRLSEAAKSREAATKAERRQLTKALESESVAAAAKRDKELAADLRAAREGLDAEDARAKERAAELKQARAEWGAGLDSLAELLGDLPGVSAPGDAGATPRGPA